MLSCELIVLRATKFPHDIPATSEYSLLSRYPSLVETSNAALEAGRLKADLSRRAAAVHSAPLHERRAMLVDRA
jgi:hypothetical protein